MLIDTMSRKLVQRMLDNEVIKFDDWEIYMYGLQLIISTVFKLAGFMLFAWAMDWVLEAIIFLTVFGMIRIHAGGSHSKSYLMCFIVTGIMMTMAILLGKFLTQNEPLIIMPLILMIGTVLIFMYAPIDTPNRRLNSKERKINRIRSLFVTLILAAIVLAVSFLYPEELVFCNIAAVTILFEGITLTPIFAD